LALQRSAFDAREQSQLDDLLRVVEYKKKLK